MKIAGRLFSSGSRDRRQSATLRVRIVSPGAVRSQATVSIVCGAQLQELFGQLHVAVRRLDESCACPRARRSSADRPRPFVGFDGQVAVEGERLPVESPEAIIASRIDEGPTSGTTRMPRRWHNATTSAPGSATPGTPTPEMTPAGTGPPQSAPPSSLHLAACDLLVQLPELQLLDRPSQLRLRQKETPRRTGIFDDEVIE